MDTAIHLREDTLETSRADTRKAVQEHERHTKSLSHGGLHASIRINCIYIPIIADDISVCRSDAGKFL